MAKVIKRGVPEAEKVARFTCLACRSEIEFEKSDVKHVHDPRGDGGDDYVVCPVCSVQIGVGVLQWVAASEPHTCCRDVTCCGCSACVDCEPCKARRAAKIAAAKSIAIVEAVRKPKPAELPRADLDASYTCQQCTKRLASTRSRTIYTKNYTGPCNDSFCYASCDSSSCRPIQMHVCAGCAEALALTALPSFAELAAKRRKQKKA